MDPNETRRKRVDEARSIKSKIVEKGLTLASIDREYRLKPGQARQALRAPDKPGERAIAAALGTRPELLWKTRYQASGQRRPKLDWTKIRLTESPNEAAA